MTHQDFHPKCLELRRPQCHNVYRGHRRALLSDALPYPDDTIDVALVRSAMQRVSALQSKKQARNLAYMWYSGSVRQDEWLRRVTAGRKKIPPRVGPIVNADGIRACLVVYHGDTIALPRTHAQWRHAENLQFASLVANRLFHLEAFQGSRSSHAASARFDCLRNSWFVYGSPFCVIDASYYDEARISLCHYTIV